MNNQNNFFDILNLASLIVGLQNLNENREQSAHNDIEAANTRQAEFLLGEIEKRFSEQNKMILKILRILEEMRDKNGNEEK